MKLLLDTHCFLWLIHGDKRLSAKAQAYFLDTDNTIFFSAISYWEICIKQSLGKLGLRGTWQHSVDQELKANGIRWLGLEKHHCQAIMLLPDIHRDPFDRLLIAQAQTENMALVTADSNIQQYPVVCVW
jgi:PIN domain nuclease of toxin-antitoxin system